MRLEQFNAVSGDIAGVTAGDGYRPVSVEVLTYRAMTRSV